MMYRRSIISRWIQEELTAVHDQLKQAVEDNRRKRELNDKYVGKLQETILSKEKEITVLKKKIDEYNPEEMKRLLLEEADKNYQATAERLEAEIDTYREQYNRLHYEHAILKCQLQYMETEQSRTLEEMRLKYLTEVLQLKETIENLIEKQNSPQEDNSAQLRIASREVMLLKTKLKVSLAECEELQTQKEKISLQMDSMARNYSNRLAESVANTRAIESEKSKIAMQNDSFQKELSLCLDHKRKLNSELQSAVEEVLTLQTQLEDCEHRYQLKVNNLQMEIVRLKGENEAEKESLMEELRKLKLEKNILEDELGHQKQSASEKEQNFQQQLQMASEHVRKKYNDLDYEKDKLEHRLRDLELSKLDVVSQLHKELDSTKQQLQHVLEEKVENDKQLLLLKTTLDAHNRRNEELLHDDLVEHKAALRSEVNVLKEKVEFLSMQNKELIQQSDKQISEKLTQQKSQIVRKEAESEEHFNQRLSMEQQKFHLLQRIGELEMQLKEKHKDADIEKRELQNKLKLNDRLLRKLRQKLSVLQAREIELQISTEILKKNVPVEVHSRVKKELLELQRKQAEFHQIMTSATRYALPLNNVNTEMNNLKISDRKMPFAPLPSEMTANVETSSVIPFKGNDHETDLGDDVPSKRKTFLKKRLLRFPRKIKSAVQLYSSSSDLENSSQVLDISSSSIN